MIERIIDWSLRNWVVVLAAAAVLLGWGTNDTARMQVDVFPDLTAPTVSVVAEAPGMSPIEVEKLVTFPIETALNGAPGVRRVRSTSTVGLAVVTTEFQWGTQVLPARQIVAERLQLAAAALPRELPAPRMAPAASIMGEIMFVALTSDRHDAMMVKTTADWVVRRRLLAVPGVAEVIGIGGDERQYQITLRPDRLAAYRITVDEVLRAVRENNENVPAGFYFEGGQELLVQGLGRVRRAEDIGEIAVAQRGGVAVRVTDLGSVAVGPGLVRGTGAHNGKPAVVLAIQKQPAANTLELTRRLDETFAAIQATLPEGMRLETRIFRQADFIERAIDNLVAALRDGAVLIVLIVFAFLLSWRATVVTLAALPLSLAAALVVLDAAGATLNTMTLGGLAIALGVLVDDAIIVVENIVRRLRGNAAQPAEAQRASLLVVRDATVEIQGSIVFATLVIMLVFAPIFFLSGVEGRLMAPLGAAYVVALGASLAVAITVTPVLAWLLLARLPHVVTRDEPGYLAALKRVYTRLLESLVDRWRPVALAALVLLAVALWALLSAGRAFLPEFNEGSLTVNVTTLPGTSLDESSRLAGRVEGLLLAQPEVAATARRTGRAPADPHAQEIYASEIEATLVMKERGKAELLEALRTELARIAGASIVIGQPISHRIDHLLSGTRANVAIKVLGPDLHELRRVAQAVHERAVTTPGAVDVLLEPQAEIPTVAVRFLRDAIARHGMSVREVGEAIETAFRGVAASRVLEGDAVFDLVVRFDPAARTSIETMRELLLTTPAGAQVPLAALADLSRDRVPNLVSRESVQRRIAVTLNVAGRDLQGVVDDIRARVAAEVPLPAGYAIEYGGQFESAAGARRTLLGVGAAVVAGIFFLLYLAFRSVRDAALVMANLPLALIGGVVGLYLADGVISVATLVGFITLFGIATRNGVMLIAHVRHLRDHEGVLAPREAILRAANERVVPILMTALAAGLAMVPLALAGGAPGSEIQAPMAIVILAGLFSSTLLNMIVVPTLYLRFGDLGPARSPGPYSHRPTVPVMHF